MYCEMEKKKVKSFFKENLLREKGLFVLWLELFKKPCNALPCCWLLDDFISRQIGVLWDTLERPIWFFRYDPKFEWSLASLLFILYSKWLKVTIPLKQLYSNVECFKTWHYIYFFLFFCYLSALKVSNNKDWQHL